MCCNMVGPATGLVSVLTLVTSFRPAMTSVSPQGYAATMEEFERIIGLEHIKVFHFNDSKFELGQCKDRHAHIGQGYIGLDGFANFVNDPRWANHAAHLETPKKEEDDDGNEVEMDPVNLAALRALPA